MKLVDRLRREHVLDAEVGRHGLAPCAISR